MSTHPGYATSSRTNRYLVFVWPALALLLCAALWIATVVRAQAEHRRAEAQAHKDKRASQLCNGSPFRWVSYFRGWFGWP